MYHKHYTKTYWLISIRANQKVLKHDFLDLNKMICFQNLTWKYFVVINIFLEHHWIQENKHRVTLYYFLKPYFIIILHYIMSLKANLFTVMKEVFNNDDDDENDAVFAMSIYNRLFRSKTANKAKRRYFLKGRQHHIRPELYSELWIDFYIESDFF